MIREVRSGLRGRRRRDAAGTTLRLEATCPVFPQTFNNVRYEVHVPPGVAVSGGADGGLRLIDLRGPIDIDNGDGGIEVAAPGPARLHTGDGGISVSDSTGDLDLQTGDGSIRSRPRRTPSWPAPATAASPRPADAPDRIEAHTGDGSIEITLPADAPAYAVTTDTGDGSVSNSIRTDPHRARTINADTGDGSIRSGSEPTADGVLGRRGIPGASQVPSRTSARRPRTWTATQPTRSRPCPPTARHRPVTDDRRRTTTTGAWPRTWAGCSGGGGRWP